MPKMAIFEFGDTFSKAHHVGYPAVSFQGCISRNPGGNCILCSFLRKILVELI